MALKYDIKKEKDYLFFGVSGPYDLEDTLLIIERINDEAREHGYDRVVCDIYGIQFSEIVNTLDRAEMGEKAASLWKDDLKVVVVGPKPQLNRFAELVAVLRGGNMRVFDDRELAVKWLLYE